MAYTPTVYTNDASSPDLDATNLNKSEQGIKLAHDIAVPVDCSSRVAEYTGDGIPLLPDNVAGTEYKSNFVTTDGWISSRTETVLSVENNMLKIVYDGTRTEVGLSFQKTGVVYNNKFIVGKIKSTVPITSVSYYTGTTISLLELNKPNSYDTVFYGYMTSTSTLLILHMNVNQLTAKTCWLESLYIGTGSYDTPALDRAGNGNSLALNAVTPVNGKYGKEMSFNGSTSYAQASSPVIGTTGTIAIRFKRGALGFFSFLFATRNPSGYKGVGVAFSASNMLRLAFGASESSQVIDLAPAIEETTNYHTLIFTFSSSAYYSLLDATEKTGSLTNPIDMSVTNLILGGSVTTPSFSGIISHFRYDSRIWTADEARAWSLNPISIDSRV